RSVVFWEVATGKELFCLAGENYGDPGGVAFSADGQRFALARNRSVAVFDVVRGQLLAEWQNPTRTCVEAVAFAPDGRTLATVSHDGVARLWDVDAARDLAAFTWDIGPLKAVAFSPDGLRAAVSGANGTVVVWDVE